MASTTSPSPWTTPLRGHCLCGGCNYVIDPSAPIDPAIADSIRQHFEDGRLYRAGYDHCIPCRRGASSLAVPWLFVPTAWVTWTVESAKHLKIYPSSRGEVERTFCGTCGTSFTYFSKTRVPIVDINLSTLAEDDLARVEELGLLPSYHGMWGSGIRWVQKVWEKAAAAGYQVILREVNEDGEKVSTDLATKLKREAEERQGKS